MQGTNLDSKDFVQFLAKLADSTTYNKDENNTFRLRDVKGFLCFEASLMQTKDFLARYPEKNGAFLTLKCIGPDETMEVCLVIFVQKVMAFQVTTFY